jgi:foldase protein PrsA
MKLSRPMLLAAVTLVAAAALAAGCGGDDDIPSDAVAVVDGTVVSKADLDELLGRAKTSYKTQNRTFPKAGTPEYQSLQTQAVAYLVQREEYAIEAKALDVAITEAQIDKRIAEVAKEYFGGDQAALKAQLKQQGYTDAAFRDDISSQLLSEGIFEKVSAQDATVTDADVKTFYEDNKAQYTVAESREVRHILVKTKAEADDVVAQLEAGGDFGALAKKLSQDPGSKDAGGKLTVRRGETVAPFEKAAFELDVNEVSEPIKTEFGYHIVEPLSEITAGSTTPFAEVAKQIRSQLTEQKKQTALEAWSKQLAEDYKDKVTYATGYAPPETTDPAADTADDGQ